MKQETYQDHESNYPAKPIDMDNVCIYDYVFHYNIYSHSWAAIPRESYQAYWSESTHPSIIRSNDIKTLIDIITRLCKDPDFLNKISDNV